MFRTLIFSVLFVLVACQSKRNKEVVETRQALLSQVEAERLGYKVGVTDEVQQSAWDARQFGSATILSQAVKSLSPMAQNATMFPRFTIFCEQYGSVAEATVRAGRLRDHDPSLDNKDFPELVLRDGFCVGKDVWIVTTDAVIFSHSELQEFTWKLKSIKSESEQR